MILFEKNFGIIICTIFIYLKFRREKFEKLNMILIMIISILLSIVMVWVDVNLKMISIPVMILGIIVIVRLLLGDKIKKVILLVLTAFAVSYSILMISAMVIGFFSLVLPYDLVLEHSQFLSLILQLILVKIICCIKRMKEGMFFSQYFQKELSNIIISLCIIYVAILLNRAQFNIYGIIYYFCALFLAVLIFIYWRSSITRHYLERLSLRNIDSLNDELNEKNAYIKELLEDKARLEKLNHKNYKLVPAMQEAVLHYLNDVKEYMDSTMSASASDETAATNEGIDIRNDFNGFIEEGNRLIEELNKMSGELTEFIDSENLTGEKEIPSSGVPRVDYILSYMYERSKREDFTLKINIEQKIDKLTAKLISEEDLATLFADLIENAIIATKHNKREDISVHLGIMKKEYIIEVYDSGTPFDKDVLLKYGVEKITTHADENGSGIGMMQTYEILSKCGASLYIDELSEESGLYTKRISIIFNRKNQFVLYTRRAEEELSYLHKRPDLLIIRR